MSVKDKLNDDKDCSSNGAFSTDDLNNNQIKSHCASEEDHFQASDRKPRSEKHSKDRSRRGSHNDRHQKCHTENNQVSQQRISHEDEDFGAISVNKIGKSEHCGENDQKSRSDLKGKAESSSNRGKLGSAEQLHRKSKTSKSSKGSLESLSFDTSEKRSTTLKLVSVTGDRSAVRPKSSEAQNKKRKKRSGGEQSVLGFAQESDCMESSKPQNKRAKTKHEDQQSDCDSEAPSMSFESYLNYDDNVSKRREKLAVKKSKRASREGKDRTPYMKTSKSTSRSCAASDKPVKLLKAKGFT